MKFYSFLKTQWMKGTRSRLTILLASVFLLSAIVMVVSLISGWNERRQHQELMTSLQNETIAITETTTAETTATTITPVPTTTETESHIPTKIDFVSLQDQNPDTVAWIELTGTVIDYPVVKSDDNDYYLHRDFLGQDVKAGSIFMDYRNTGTLTDRHTILYGHNMRDGSMFAGLMAYKDGTYFAENDKIFIDTPEGRTIWQIFSVYVTTTDFYYIVTDFPDDKAFLEFLQIIEDKSHFRGAISPNEDDELLTLSTCTYEYDDARFVVHAIRIE